MVSQETFLPCYQNCQIGSEILQNSAINSELNTQELGIKLNKEIDLLCIN